MDKPLTQALGAERVARLAAYFEAERGAVSLNLEHEGRELLVTREQARAEAAANEAAAYQASTAAIDATLSADDLALARRWRASYGLEEVRA
jgi:hypothetical protein